jgi:hypothetical protein
MTVCYLYVALRGKKTRITGFTNIFDLNRIKHLLHVTFTSNECRQMCSLIDFLARNIFTVSKFFSEHVVHIRILKFYKISLSLLKFSETPEMHDMTNYRNITNSFGISKIL